MTSMNRTRPGVCTRLGICTRSAGSTGPAGSTGLAGSTRLAALPRLAALTVLAASLGLAACSAQETPRDYAFSATDHTELPRAMPALAESLLEDRVATGLDEDPDVLFRLQVMTGRDAEALQTLTRVREQRIAALGGGPDVPYLNNPAELAHLETELLVRARMRSKAEEVDFGTAFAGVFREIFAELDDRQAHRFFPRVEYMLDLGRARLDQVLERYRDRERISGQEALQLVGLYHRHSVKERILPFLVDLVDEDAERRYVIDEGVLIETPDGAVLHATVVRPRGRSGPQSASLTLNIYATRVNDLIMAKLAAVHGFVGVVANPRGKRVDSGTIEPYRHEARDTHAVLAWIVEQPWSNGDVAVWGGSYGGYAAWAALKDPHPAIKAVAAQAAAIPGLGLPMHNNVFLSANYCWAFFVTNNRTLDYDVCEDGQRWASMQQEYYASGRPYREIDAIDGTPNPYLQEWLDHPNFDEYWQRLVPFEEDFAGVDVPVLTLTGYYDDGQVSALHYFNEHHRHNPDADHTLVIGPADHSGAQWGSPAELRGLALDPGARISPPDLTFEWFDHILRGGDRPSLLRDRVNYQVMGTDRWRHAPSMAELGDDTLRLYLSDRASGEHRALDRGPQDAPGHTLQEIDFRERETTSFEYYPWPIVGPKPETGDALVFVSEPFEEPVEVAGAFGGRLNVTINKRDFDPLVVLFEETPDGRWVHLSYYLGRASYARDMTERNLLEPGEVESIPIRRSYMTARRLLAGSRLVAVVDVNRSPGAQINYGTGGDVSSESIEDAGEPLRVQWHNDSYIEIQVRR